MRRSANFAILAVVLSCSAEPALAQSAVIEGTLALAVGPAKKTASRYPTGATGVRGMQHVPAVVYLEGRGLGSAPVDRGAGGAATVDLVQRDTLFAPAAVAVRTGTVVRFPNADPFFHNVFSYSSNARFDLGRYPEGDSRQFTFQRPGIARVFCEVHEFMRAVVVVTDHPFHAVVDDDGSFRIAGVPPGEYTFRAYHPDLGALEQPLAVRPGETVRMVLAFGS